MVIPLRVKLFFGKKQKYVGKKRKKILSNYQISVILLLLWQNISSNGTIFGYGKSMKTKILFWLLIFSSATVFAQNNPILLESRVIDGDTLPCINLSEVKIYSLKIPKSAQEQKRLIRLIRNIKKVYPYAKLAGIKLRQYDKMLQNAKNDRERKKLMRQVEKEINSEYGPDLKKLTFSQGKILIKLIDRETGATSYNLVKELRGNFTAFFYQAFARIWGYNLKSTYDPEGDDKQIETIVKMIELGQL